MEDRSNRPIRFRPLLGLLGVFVGLLGAYLFSMDWPEIIVCGGLGFIVGGAAAMFGGIWKYLLVFFALAAGFVWWLLHYVVQ